MADQTRRNGNMAVIATMFALFFMIAFVTNLAGSMGVIVKEQFKASNTLSQLGSAANFLAYLSYWLTVALLAYLLLYAQVLSNPSSGCGSAGNRSK